MNKYIKFKLNDKESFNKAIKKAQELWYKVWDFQDSLTWWNTSWILSLVDDEWSLEYLVPIESEDELIRMWYKILFDYSK